MISFPNAKINIGLNITEKRPDGFHNIETIFYPIGLSDVLEINTSNNELKFKNTGLTIENGNLESNLCYKAYEILNRDLSIPNINIHLHKIIPFGSGLGGGSSDASFTLKSINSIFNLNLSDDDLLKYAGQIGSDCPIFISNQPCFAKEKGNNLVPVDLNLKGLFLALVHPGIHVNTGLAYSKSTPKKPRTSLLELIKNPIESWKDTIINDFENIIFTEHPEIGEIKSKLYDSGAIYASMTGSGSSVFGIFKKEINIKARFNNLAQLLLRSNTTEKERSHEFTSNYFTWVEELP